MEVLELLYVASMPVIKVLLITAVGLILALDRVNILGEQSRTYLNLVVFYVFNPALVGSNLAETITFESFLTMWFMPINIFITFIIGSVLGWVLVKITKAPKNIHGLIIGTCSAGNLGNLLIIIVPAICDESGSPFGTTETCSTNGLAYASLSMALGAVFIWTYVYNIVRISSGGTIQFAPADCPEISTGSSPETSLDHIEPLLPSTNYSVSEDSVKEISVSHRITQCLSNFAKKINLKAIFAPSTIGAIFGFVIGMISPIRKLLIGSDAPLHVLDGTAYMIGEAAIPAITLVCGANLLQGLYGSQIQLRNVFGIIAVRYIFSPLLGILIVKGAIYVGIVGSNSLYQFVLLLQYALPPAMNIATITQLFGAGHTECSVIMMWTYAFASFALTLWSAFFMWFVTL